MPRFIPADRDERLLADVAAVARTTVNQWAAVLTSTASHLVGTHLRAALKDSAVHGLGLSDDVVASIRAGMARTDALRPKISFEPVQFTAFRTAAGVVLQGQFDPATIETCLDGCAPCSEHRSREALPLVMRSKAVPVASPRAHALRSRS